MVEINKDTWSVINDENEIVEYKDHFYRQHFKESTPEDRIIFGNLISSMSDEAKFIIGLILNTPLELYDFLKSTNFNITRQSITLFLRHKTWKIPTIKKAFAEITTTLQEGD